MIEICLTPGGGDPHGSERGGAASGRRSREILDRRAQALANHRDRGQRDKAIVVIVGAT
jgi:hypothetical protein